MSEENVEIVRRYLKSSDAIPREVFPAWVARFWESDGDYYPGGFPGARPCHGRKEIVSFLAGLQDPAEFFAGLHEPWDYATVVKEARAIGDDRVYVHGQMWAEGSRSGMRLEGDLYYCFWLRHGRFVRAEDHLSEKAALHALGVDGDALEAAGLSE
jgi:hypothetical protein